MAAIRLRPLDRPGRLVRLPAPLALLHHHRLPPLHPHRNLHRALRRRAETPPRRQAQAQEQAELHGPLRAAGAHDAAEL